MCDVLDVSRSGFYAWRTRPVSARSQRQAKVISEIKQIHSERYKNSYGSPRVQQELVDRGFSIWIKQQLFCKLSVDRFLRF